LDRLAERGDPVRMIGAKSAVRGALMSQAEAEIGLGFGLTQVRRARLALAVWSAAAAFGAYFCMYAFRKPFTAAMFTGGTVWGISEKTALVTAQVLGYTLSKFIGIRVVAEISPARRAAAILVLIGVAEAALVGFALVPSPLHVFCLFLNGLPLGMIFGMVLGFLEGRRLTEALTAGLCTSFILADGITKSVGTWLLQNSMTERWMPAAAGALFVPPLLASVWMLTRIPPPDDADIASRSERQPMDRHERVALVRRYAPGLLAIVVVYLLANVARSIRADFAPELWKSLGVTAVPSTFAISEMVVALGVLVVNGLSILIADNRRAFFTSLAVAGAGAILMAGSLVGLNRSWVGGFAFMVLMGLGLYLPYVAIHTTVFERLLAMTRERGNLGFLMYLADAAGYLGYAGVMVGKSLVQEQGDFLRFYTIVSWLIAALALLSVVLGWWYFAKRKLTGASPGATS
jgi:Family of unknown function (DUF5690)